MLTKRLIEESLRAMGFFRQIIKLNSMRASGLDNINPLLSVVCGGLQQDG